MFKKYKRKEVAELRPLDKQEIKHGLAFLKNKGISVSSEDIKNGSPKKGDMIARNPKNHDDQWLVSEQYFKDNFAELK